MRLPVTTDLKTRLSNTTKDARLVNALIEQKADGPNARKRPGMIATGWDFTSPQGIGLGLGGLTAMIYSDTLELIDVDSPPPPPVYIGDLVGGYYAMIDNPPTSPGGGDAYWSATPPGATRYKSALRFKEFISFGDLHITMTDSATSPWIASQLQGPIAASRAATYKKLAADAAASGGFIVWDNATVHTPPVGNVYRAMPFDINSSGYASDFYLSSPASVNWSAGYSPASVGAASTLQGYSTTVAVSWQKSSRSVTITSSGNVAAIAFTEFGSYTAGTPYKCVRWIKVSGSSYAEYNGTFEWDLSTNPLDSVAGLSGSLYYTMTGTPASATTTATVEYFF